MGVYGISARNVREALPRGVALLIRKGYQQGRVWTFGDGPVAFTFRRPKQHVLASPYHDRNPMADLVDGLSILWGGSRIGRKMLENDQLDELIKLLRRDPDTSHALLTFPASLGLQIAFRTVEGALDMTVFSVASQLFEGVCGLDAVQFPLLLEYAAAMVGLPMGTYVQIVNDFSMSIEPWREMADAGAIAADDAPEAIFNKLFEPDPYGPTLPLINNRDSFNRELNGLRLAVELLHRGMPSTNLELENSFLISAYYAMLAHSYHHLGNDYDKAFEAIGRMPAQDWRDASRAWLIRQREKALTVSPNGDR